MSRPTFPPRLARVACLAALLSGCASTYPRRDPQGQAFPTVRGTSLAGQPVTIPADVAGAPALLLVGYQRQTQLDLDRWLLGIHDANLQVKTYELPTIPGLVPGVLSGRIDQGMRRGIPREDWGSVVTVYGDAPKLAAFTGNDNDVPGRVLLVDRAGKVVFFHDAGYSVGALVRLRDALARLGIATPPTPCRAE
jgi:hypothetical protein